MKSRNYYNRYCIQGDDNAILLMYPRNLYRYLNALCKWHSIATFESILSVFNDKGPCLTPIIIYYLHWYVRANRYDIQDYTIIQLEQVCMSLMKMYKYIRQRRMVIPSTLCSPSLVVYMGMGICVFQGTTPGDEIPFFLKTHFTHV